jgi:hypothetical protein
MEGKANEYDAGNSIHGGGCFYLPSITPDLAVGQVLLNEIASSFVLLFLAFGLGLDPRQAMLFSPSGRSWWVSHWD